MKRLEELGISPAPWGFRRSTKTHYAWICCDDRLRGGAKKSNMFFVRYPYFGMMDERRACREQTANARLIAAAPKLYEVCYRIERWEDHAKSHNGAIEPWSDIMHDLHKALAEAAGEEVSDGE